MNSGSANPPLPPTTSPDDEAAAGNLLPDPVLPPRALAELRLAFRADADIPEEADLRFLKVLQQSANRKKTIVSFWRGFQIAAVCAIVASFVYYGSHLRDSDRLRIPSINDRIATAESKKELAKEAVAAPAATTASTTPIPTDPVTLASSQNVTILDAFNLARRLESSAGKDGFARNLSAKRPGGFTASGERISEIDEVDSLAAKAVGTDIAQVQKLRRSRDVGALDKRSDGLSNLAAPDAARGALSDREEKARPAAPLALSAVDKHGVRILSYDIMLDVGSRSLAAFQVEVSMSAPDTARVTMMMVRGGDHPALQRRPFYDTKRVSTPGSRVTFNVANFDTGHDLPTGDVFVARVVLVVVGSGNPGVTAKLVVAAGADGVPIPAGLRVAERATPPLTNPEEVQKTLEADGE